MIDFQEFREKIQPKLQGLDEQRLEVRKKINKTNRFVIIIEVLLLIPLILSISHENEYGALFFIIMFIVMFLGFYRNRKIKKPFLLAFKGHIIHELVKAVNPKLDYHPNSYIAEDAFEGSGIFQNRIDRYKGEDLVRGMQGKTEIEFSELHAEEKHTTRDSKGRTQTRYVTIFKGLFMIADFHKDFNGRTVVLPDSAESMFGWIGKKLQKMNMNRDDLVYMENAEFEKEFVVYSTDQVEARYILSTSMIDRMLELKKRLNCKLYFSFIHSKVNIAISTGTNFFEPKLKESLLESDALQRFYNELMLCLGLVEDLNLNTRIWGKE